MSSFAEAPLESTTETEQNDPCRVSYQPLEVLTDSGVASGDIQKLNDAGYHTVESIAHATIRKLR